MALAYTAPTWTDGSGEGISASNLQAMSNCIQGLVQGSDKSVHAVQINGSTITLTYADGTQESFSAADMKSIAQIAKTGTAGLVDTYTITYTDGTTTTFTVTNGQDGPAGQDGRDGVIQYTEGDGISISDQNVISADVDQVFDGTSTDAQSGVAIAGALSSKADTSDLDDWTAEVTATTSGDDVIAEFDNLSDDYGYALYGVDEFIDYKSASKTTGTQSGIKVTYVLDGATAGTSKCVLRILK